MRCNTTVANDTSWQKVKYAVSSIFTYFENKESLINCYKCNTPILSAIFNFDKLVTEIDIGTSTPDA